jgi:hypothetical protein
MKGREAYPETGSVPSLVSGSTTAVGIVDRLIERISCASESGIDIPRLRQLLFIGLAVLAIFELASRAFPILSGPARTPDPPGFQTFNLLLICGSALGLRWIGRNWRWWTLAFCVVLMVSVTLTGIVVDEDDPVLITLFVLIITSAVTIPWDARWQGSLGIIALGAFTITVMTGVVEENDLQQWLTLAILRLLL